MAQPHDGRVGARIHAARHRRAPLHPNGERLAAAVATMHHARRDPLPVLLLVIAMLGGCERTATRPPEERIDAPEADADRDGGDGVTDDAENPGSRVEENAGTVEDDS